MTDTKDAIVRSTLVNKLGSSAELRTVDGHIVIINDGELIEVVALRHWKHALDLILSHGFDEYKSFNKRIHLYYEDDKEIKGQIVDAIGHYCDIIRCAVTYEKI